MTLELERYSQQLSALNEELAQLSKALGLDALREELRELEQEIAAPDAWDNIDKAQKVNARIKSLSGKIGGFEALLAKAEDVAAMIELSSEEGEDAFLAEIAQDLQSLSQKSEQMRLSTLLRGEYDQNDCLLSIHAGAGGTEAQDWAGMLYRMYTRYCERQGYQVKVLDFQDGDEAGIKSVTIEASGENAYGYLKAEKGVHRLVRISPFDSSARRHTSFASLDVAPVLEDEGGLLINPEDLRIDTYRASGAGGQHVNRTDSAVRITHIPTGVVVQCQNERSQTQNKETCMKMMRARLAELKEREQAEKMSDIKGEMKKIEWGSQIRSYVFHPYSMVKDHRTGYEVGSTDGVMDGEIEGFITEYLKMS